MNTIYDNNINNVKPTGTNSLIVGYTGYSIPDTAISTIATVVDKSMYSVDNAYFSNSTPSSITINDGTAHIFKSHSAGYLSIELPSTEAFVKKEEDSSGSDVYRKSGSRDMYTEGGTNICIEDILKPTISFSGINRPVSLNIDGYTFIMLCDDNASYGIYKETVSGSFTAIHEAPPDYMVEDGISENNIIAISATDNIIVSVSGFDFQPIPFDTSQGISNIPINVPYSKSVVGSSFDSFSMYHVIDIHTRTIVSSTKIFMNSVDVFEVPRCTYRADSLFNITRILWDTDRYVDYFNLMDVGITDTAVSETKISNPVTIDSVEYSDVALDAIALISYNDVYRTEVIDHLPENNVRVVVDQYDSLPCFDNNRLFYNNGTSVGSIDIATGNKALSSDAVTGTSRVIRVSDSIIGVEYYNYQGTDATGRLSVQNNIKCYDSESFIEVDSTVYVLPYMMLSNKLNGKYIYGKNGNDSVIVGDTIIKVDTDYSCHINKVERGTIPNTINDIDKYYGTLTAIVDVKKEYVNGTIMYYLYSDRSDGDCYEYMWTDSDGTIVSTNWMMSTAVSGMYVLTITSTRGVTSKAYGLCDYISEIPATFYNPDVYLEFISENGDIVQNIEVGEDVIIRVLFSVPTVLSDNVYSVNGVDVDILQPITLLENNYIEVAVAAIDGATYSHYIPFTAMYIIRYIMELRGIDSNKYLLSNLINGDEVSAGVSFSTLYNSEPNNFDVEIDVINDADTYATIVVNTSDSDTVLPINDIGNYTFNAPSRFKSIDESFSVVDIAFTNELYLVSVSVDRADNRFNVVRINRTLHPTGVQNPPQVPTLSISGIVDVTDDTGTLYTVPNDIRFLADVVDNLYTVTFTGKEVMTSSIDVNVSGREQVSIIEISITEVTDATLTWADIPDNQDVSSTSVYAYNSTMPMLISSDTSESSSVVFEYGVLGTVSTTRRVSIQQNNSITLEFGKPNVYFVGDLSYDNFSIGTDVTVGVECIFPLVTESDSIIAFEYEVVANSGTIIISEELAYVSDISLGVVDQNWLDTNNNGDSRIEITLLARSNDSVSTKPSRYIYFT